MVIQSSPKFFVINIRDIWILGLAQWCPDTMFQAYYPTTYDGRTSSNRHLLTSGVPLAVRRPAFPPALCGSRFGKRAEVNVRGVPG